MKEVCYLKDPETGKFVGSKPGCSHGGGGEVSEEVLQRLEREKGITKQRVGAAAALGNLKPKDSELKDKAERIAREVNKGELTFKEGLYQLSKGSSPLNRYAKAVDLLESDLSHWKDIYSKGGSDEVDTLLGSYIGVPVPGVSNYVMKLADPTSTAQKEVDGEVHLPSGKSREEVERELDKRLDDIKRRSVDFNKLNKKGRYNKSEFTKYNGNNTMETKATYYNLHGHQTTNGEIYDKYKFTGAMQPIDVGDLHNGKYEYAKVTNKVNGESVIIKINDKGPMTRIKVKGQDEKVKLLDPTKALDLSVAAYAKITHEDGAGKLNVKIEFLSKSAGKAQYEEQERTTDMNKIRKDVDRIEPPTGNKQ
ncbi:MAG: septal ring lytic transglycosylase RlpA family protein [Nitrospirota bacterium]